MKSLIHDLLGLFILAALSLLFGISLNLFRHDPLPWKYQSREERLEKDLSQLGSLQIPIAPTSIPPAEVLSLEEFNEFVNSRHGIILDARIRYLYNQGHVPAALSLSGETFLNSYKLLENQLNKDLPLVIYCSNINCGDSELVRRMLIRLGYKDVALFRGGWAEWTQANLPVEKSP